MVLGVGEDGVVGVGWGWWWAGGVGFCVGLEAITKMVGCAVAIEVSTHGQRKPRMHAKTRLRLRHTSSISGTYAFHGPLLQVLNQSLIGIEVLLLSIFLLVSIEPCQILLCKKRSYELAFADRFAMLSRPHVLLSRALCSLELLSRRFRGGLSHSTQAFAGLSQRDLLWLFSR